MRRRFLLTLSIVLPVMRWPKGPAQPTPSLNKQSRVAVSANLFADFSNAICQKATFRFISGSLDPR
jgi:hypothetical protein